jgi:hypothetical protein
LFRERADVWPQLYPMRPKEINLEKRESRSSPSFLLPSRRFAAAIPGAEVVVFPNASHMTFVEVPESYLSVVRGFVEAAQETAPAAAVAVAGERRAVGRGLLNGASPCTWSTGGGFYAYPFTAYWNATSGDYGWEARIVAPSQAVVGTSSGRRRRRRRGEETRGREAVTGVGALRFGGAADVYDRPYAEVLDPAVEVGWAAWLVPPEVRPDPQRRGEWTSRAFVGTRVSTASHTFCGCQSMRGDAAAFRLTEHGRASVDIPPRPARVPWYANLTRREISAQIRATCAALARRTSCPEDNETAYAEWASGRDNGTYWRLPPWVEVYSSLPV